MKLPRNLSGIVFGRLTVIQKSSRKNYWVCLCSCGRAKEILRSSLVSNKTNSCGCLRRETLTTHGMYLTPEYAVWEGMISRCNNPNDVAYKYYGAVGIVVCDEWHSFTGFIRDMGRRPSSNLTLDRKNPLLGYCKENCHWVTRETQQQNKQKQCNNKSGITGVWFQETSKYQYWVASWSVKGKNFNKAFSVQKLGYDLALCMAIDYRNSQINKLNDEGMQYTQYHGLASKEISELTE